MLRLIEKLFRLVMRVLSIPLITAMMPLKIYAYRTRFRFVKRLILEVTSFFDWGMTLANVQNPVVLLHHWIYGGNFVFGKSVMIVDHEVAREQIAGLTLRGNRFMGVDLVTNDPAVFVTNAGPITNSQPIRRLQRAYIDSEIMNDEVRGFDQQSLRDHCAEIIEQWQDDEKMAAWWSIRGSATRIFLRILTNKILPKDVIDNITFNYVRRFAEFSIFGRYLPAMLWILGTREGIREDVYIRLRRYGIDNVVIDMTLFAAMFSVGTNVMRSVELCVKHGIYYPALLPHEKMQFVMESQRLHPTVTSVHRIVEENETVEVSGLNLKLRPGDEVHYPFACINRDLAQFEAPGEFRIDRTREEFGKILSWSAGPHVCPAKDLSILAVVMMLDALSERYDLRKLKIFNPEF